MIYMVHSENFFKVQTIWVKIMKRRLIMGVLILCSMILVTGSVLSTPFGKVKI